MTDPFDPTEPTTPSSLPPTGGPGAPGAEGSELAPSAVSAYLDGEATPEEIARVEGDPALVERVGRVVAAAEAIRDVPPPPPGLLDGAIVAALAAFDERGTGAPAGRADDPASAGADETPTATPGGTVTPLAPRPTRWWQQAPTAAVATAAAVLLAVVGLVGLSSIQDGGDDADTATAAADAQFEETGGASESIGSADEDATALAPAADGLTDAAGSSGGGTAARLSFSGPDALADYLRDQLTVSAAGSDDASESSAVAESDDGAEGDDGGSADAPPRVDDEDPCGAVALLGLDPATVVTVVGVVVDDSPVTAVVHGFEDDRRLVVVDDASCQVVVDRPLEG